jgi:hypothetical protein
MNPWCIYLMFMVNIPSKDDPKGLTSEQLWSNFWDGLWCIFYIPKVPSCEYVSIVNFKLCVK